MHILNATILSAGCLEILPAFDLEKILQIISLGRVTKFYAVPTIYTRLLTEEKLKEKLGQVRYCFSAAASSGRGNGPAVERKHRPDYL